MPDSRQTADLSGRRILVVEDEYMIADDMQRELEALGAEVVGPAGSLGEAMNMLQHAEVNLAVIDVNLGGEKAFPLADALQARDLHFVFTTGYDQAALPDRYAAVPRCEKPVNMRRLISALLKSGARPASST